MRKIQILRPEIDVVFHKPFLCCIFFAVWALTFIRVGKIKYQYKVRSTFRDNAGHIYNKTVWYICIPKFKVVDSL